MPPPQLRPAPPPFGAVDMQPPRAASTRQNPAVRFIGSPSGHENEVGGYCNRGQEDRETKPAWPPLDHLFPVCRFLYTFHPRAIRLFRVLTLGYTRPKVDR